jgi:metal-responsive CopG/Arc/MetJ family transcriptional regulator
MKTAISLADDLFFAVRQFAEEENLSRSQVFARAVAEYVARQQNRRILRELNRVYQDPPTEEEKTLRKKGKRYYGAKVAGAGAW